MLAAEWHPEKNGNLLPNDILSGSDKKIWWKGKCGHEWRAAVYNRSKENGSKCPYCFGVGSAKKIDDVNSFASFFPNIAKEWHSKNKKSPKEYSPGSGELVWWKGSCGHEWEATISKRTNGRGCPYCTGKKVDQSNSLATKNPKLAKEWHVTFNGALTVNDVTAGSGKKVWWKCGTCNFEWQAVINNRNRGRGCPRCMGKV
jgi:DNA-directed RNA polymerase subunit RPC12/RpoP